MFMAAAASLYYSSPRSISSAKSTIGHCNPPSSSPVDIEFHVRGYSYQHHQSSPHPVAGISSPPPGASLSLSPCSASDAIGIDGKSLLKRPWHIDSSTLSESCKRLGFTATLKLGTRSSLLPLQDRSSVDSTRVSANAFSDNELVTKLKVDDRSSLDAIHNRLHHTFLSEIDMPGSEIILDTPRLTRVGCSSISEFFCKPLFTEVFRTPKDILRWAQQQHQLFKDSLVMKAFKEAEEAHEGQFRANGDLYLVHCVETAMILATIGASRTVVAAGLLHDTLDDTSLGSPRLKELFGLEVTNLVEGVTKLSEFSKLARDSGTAYKSIEADRLHTMMLAMTDIRVVLIKLADRLHNMRTLGALSKDKQSGIAKETLEVFAPLAGRLGIWSWKAELEDLCFKHLQYHCYQELHSKLSEGSRERTIMSAIRTLDESLSLRRLQYLDLCGRSKNLYSIHNKMLLKGRTVDDIYDVQGLRLIVNNVEDCYLALEIVHSTWQCVPGKLKDYIRQPKMNGYQSLHTVVCDEGGCPLEIQIRTMEMHHQAEFGVAAHWQYKEHNSSHSMFVLQMVEWARWVLSWQNEIMDTKLRLSRMDGDAKPMCPFPLHREGCPYSELSKESPHYDEAPLFVIVLEADQMMVQELPGNSSVADLLERSAKEDELVPTVGGFWEEIRPKVNRKEVTDIQQKLNMGDLVELQPFVSGESLNECREKLMRMFNDCSIEGRKMEPPVFHAELSEAVVF